MRRVEVEHVYVGAFGDMGLVRPAAVNHRHYVVSQNAEELFGYVVVAYRIFKRKVESVLLGQDQFTIGLCAIFEASWTLEVSAWAIAFQREWERLSGS